MHSARTVRMAARTRARFARKDLQVPERMQGPQVFPGKPIAPRRQAQVALPRIGRYHGLIDRDRIGGLSDSERA